MKNKKKVLIAVAAMALVAVGTAGVSTAAWYVSEASVSKTLATNTGTLTAQKTDKTLGSFTFTPKFTAPNAADLKVDLTNSSGVSKLFTDSNKTNTIEVQPANATADFSITGIEVSYTAGSAGASKATIQAAYNTLLAAENAAKMSVTVTPDVGSIIRLCAAADGTGAFDASALKVNAAHTWSDDEVTALKFTVNYAEAVHLYVGLTGDDNNIQTTDGIGNQVVTFGIALSAN